MLAKVEFNAKNYWTFVVPCFMVWSFFITCTVFEILTVLTQVFLFVTFISH